MGILDLLLTAAALSMDAFAVSVSKGLAVRQPRTSQALITAAYFGIFQAGMPLIGYFLAGSFMEYIRAFDHWIAFSLLAVIGVNMLIGAFGSRESRTDTSFGPKSMLPLALATSIDALAAGVSFSAAGANIWLAAAVTGGITFLLSATGVRLGSFFGSKYQKGAELAGGAVLILMGIKILIEHLSGAA